LNIPSRKQALTPLKKPRPFHEFGVLDIESRKWTKFLMCGLFDGRRYWYRRQARTALKEVFKSDLEVWYAHFGGIFDFLFLIKAAIEDGYSLKTLIPRGSGILVLELEKSGVSRTFYDSSALLSFSLKSLAKSFGTPTQKGELNVSRLRKVTKKLIVYNESDCRALFEILTKHFKSPLLQNSGPAQTTASQALLVYRTMLKKPIPRLPASLDSQFREAYAGGRTEIFRPLHEGPELLHCYDINSLYPHVMATTEMPGRFLGVRDRIPQKGLGFAKITVEVSENTYYPVLWKKRIKDSDGAKIEKFIFPTGKITGLWPINEIKYAEEQGTKILKVHEVFEFSNEGLIFEEYIRRLYEIRLTTTDPVQKIHAKLMMNALYGRMAIRLDRESIQREQFLEGETPWREIRVKNEIVSLAKKTSRYQGYSNVAIGAFVTAGARIANHRVLSRLGDSCFYTDTDSFFTTRTLPTSDVLGGLKHEYSVERACFLLPKTYAAGDKIAMKGFEKAKLKKFSYDDFKHALEGELKLKIKTSEKMARLSTALKNGKILYLQKASTKEIRSRYDKRVLFRDSHGAWGSRPIHIGN
jgi:hypothetical protein